jgi:hypothetical protein
MPYWDVVTRSFKIAWNHKYLWLVAFFAGESGGNLTFNYSPPTNKSPDLPAMQEQATSWVSDHTGLIVALGLAWLVLAIGLFILGAVCEGATIRGSAEHDAERPFGLRPAWTMGVHTMWAIVRFRLVLLALYLPLFILVVAWLVGLVVALLRQDAGLLLSLVVGGLLLFLVFFIYAVYLLFIDRFGSRAIILEERKALPAVARAHRLLFRRFGRSLLVLILSLAIALAIVIVLGCLSSVLVLPLLLAIYASSATGSAAFWPVLILTAIVLIPVYLAVGGFLAAQSSTYWTLAFRRLDVDYYAPAYVTPAYPPSPTS